MSAWDAVNEALRDARLANLAADQHADAAANLLKDRLRQVSGHHLAKIKRELRGFNLHTHKWRQS